MAADNGPHDAEKSIASAPALAEQASALIQHLGYRPLVSLTFGLVVGVVLAEQLHIRFSVLLVLFLLVTAGGFIISHRHSPASHLWLVAAFLAVGLCLHSAQFVVPRSDISQYAPSESANINGRIVSIPTQNPHWRRMVVEVLSVGIDHGSFAASGLLSLAQSEWETPVVIGDGIAAQISDLALPPRALNLGQFDMRRYLARQGITAQARIETLRKLPGPVPWQFKLKNLVHLSRQRALDNLERAMPGSNSDFYAHLMAGMVYGLRAGPGIDKQIEDLFRRTGTIHLLVVSGAQVTFIVFTIILLVTAGRRRALHPWHILIIAPAVVGFALLAGLAPSVSRSLVMAAVLIYALVSGRRYDLINALALAVFVLVIADTNIVFDMGAQLTFAAVIGLAIYSPRPYRDALGRRHRPSLMTRILLATLGAWIMVTPILAHNFYSFAALANVANAIAVPISILVIPLGMLALISGATLLPVTVVLCGLARVLMQVMLLSNRLCLALPFAYVDNIYFSRLAMAAWYVGMGGIVLVLVKPGLRRRVRALASRVDWRWVAVGLVAVTGLALVVTVAGGSAASLSVTFLAVGDGQCAVIESPGGSVIMVDAGSRQYPSLQGALLADRVILPFLSRRGIRRLDALVITHPQSDHCNAVPRLLQRMPVAVILEPGFNPDTNVWQAVEQTANDYQVPVETVRAGGRLNLGKRAEAAVLAPSYPLITGSRDDLNNNSVVLRLQYNEVSLLMLADQEKTGLARLITWSRQHGVPLRSTIMQVPHHGRNFEQALPIIQLSQPQLGIISAEHKLVPTAYPFVANAVEFIQTGNAGMITVATNGEDVRVCGFLNGCRRLDW